MWEGLLDVNENSTVAHPKWSLMGALAPDFYMLVYPVLLTLVSWSRPLATDSVSCVKPQAVKHCRNRTLSAMSMDETTGLV